MPNKMSALTSDDGLGLLKSGKFSDYKIICGGHEFNVHRIIIATKSESFAICINGKFAESESGITQLPEHNPFIVALALLFIYTGESSTERVIEVWPAIMEAGKALEESTESFLRRMIELYKTGHRCLVRNLCQYAENEMFGRVIQPPDPDGSERRCVFCGCDHNFGGCEDRHDDWADGCSGVDGCFCDEYKKEFSHSVRDWIGDILLLLRLIFEELPDHPTVRARGVCAALDAATSLPLIALPDLEELGETARKDITELLEQYDLVAWNVAKQWKKSGGWDRFAVHAHDRNDWENGNGGWGDLDRSNWNNHNGAWGNDGGTWDSGGDDLRA